VTVDILYGPVSVMAVSEDNLLISKCWHAFWIDQAAPGPASPVVREGN
jgi:hypothetical protein